MKHRTCGLLTAILATAALSACAGASDDGDLTSEDQAAIETTSEADPEQSAPHCTTATGYTLSFSGYDSETITLSTGARTATLPGGNVAFRKRRYRDESFSVDVYKGLGEYGASIFDAAGKPLGACTLRSTK